MDLHGLYRRLPAPLQDAAASARGLQLARTRYGTGAEDRVAAVLDRDHWTAAQWSSWREDRLARVLHRAANHVPWYQQHWAERRRRGDRSSMEDLANWPILEKTELRQAPQAFLADDVDRRHLVADHTSGTTGTPLTLWFDRPAVQEWYAIFEARCRRWHGVDRHSRVAMLGGQLVVPPGRARPPYWVRNAAMNQLYLSGPHIRADRAGAYAEALRHHRSEYVLGYPSAMVALARAAETAGVELPSMRVCIANAEPVSDADRALISQAFGAPVVVTYGMAEVVAAAVECEESTMHDFPDVGWIEIHDDGVTHPDEPSGTGDLVATGLVNDAMVLVRYRAGDRLSPPAASSCRCGRGLPHIAHIGGRSDDVVWTPDGRAIGRLDPVFKADLPVAEAQIIQEDLHHLRVLVVPAAGWDDDARRSVVTRTRERVGDVDVQVEVVGSIERTAAGKFRAVISHVDRPGS
jgi:phenylacetate-CoA ligase